LATFRAFRSNTASDLLSFGDPCLDQPHEILRPIQFRGENESFAQSIEAQHGSGARIGEPDLLPSFFKSVANSCRHGANSFHPP